MNTQSNPKIQTPVSPELFELAQSYLAKRISELQSLNDALTRKDFEKIHAMSHKTKGTAGAYGLPRLGELARELEAAAKNRDLSASRKVFTEIETYLNRVEITR